VLVLPAPRIQTVALDHEKTKVVALCENGLWIMVPDEGDDDAVAANLAYREAQKIVARAAEDPELIERARRQAEAVLSTFFVSVGWRVGFVARYAPVLGCHKNRG
jgi:hypothetical protein